MAFTPITSSQSISYARSRPLYRNSARESLWGQPVFFVPSSYSTSQTGFPGPRYEWGSNYDESTSPYYGNCTWWCYARCLEANGISIDSVVASDANYWYSRYSGNKSTDISNLQPGDIIVLSDSSAGHVMFVEQISGSTVTISQSAYSTRSVWSGMSCLVTSYSTSEITPGSSVNIYKNLSSAYYATVVGYLHTGGSPTPPTPGEPSMDITPTSATLTIGSGESFAEVTYTVHMYNVPVGEPAGGGNVTEGLTETYSSGWQYSSYDVPRTATKIQTLRYTRVGRNSYDITLHNIYNKTFSTGSVHADSPIYIHVDRSGGNIMFLNPEIGSIDIR